MPTDKALEKPTSVAPTDVDDVELDEDEDETPAPAPAPAMVAFKLWFVANNEKTVVDLGGFATEEDGRAALARARGPRGGRYMLVRGRTCAMDKVVCEKWMMESANQ